MFVRLLWMVYILIDVVSIWLLWWKYTRGEFGWAVWHAFCLGILLTLTAQGLWSLYQCERYWRKMKS